MTILLRRDVSSLSLKLVSFSCKITGCFEWSDYVELNPREIRNSENLFGAMRGHNVVDLTGGWRAIQDPPSNLNGGLQRKM